MTASAAILPPSFSSKRQPNVRVVPSVWSSSFLQHEFAFWLAKAKELSFYNIGPARESKTSRTAFRTPSGFFPKGHARSVLASGKTKTA